MLRWMAPLEGIFAHTPRRQRSAAERRYRPFLDTQPNWPAYPKLSFAAHETSVARDP